MSARSGRGEVGTITLDLAGAVDRLQRGAELRGAHEPLRGLFAERSGEDRLELGIEGASGA